MKLPMPDYICEDVRIAALYEPVKKETIYFVWRDQEEKIVFFETDIWCATLTTKTALRPLWNSLTRDLHPFIKKAYIRMREIPYGAFSDEYSYEGSRYSIYKLTRSIFHGSQ